MTVTTALMTMIREGEWILFSLLKEDEQEESKSPS